MKFEFPSLIESTVIDAISEGNPRRASSNAIDSYLDQSQTFFDDALNGSQLDKLRYAPRVVPTMMLAPVVACTAGVLAIGVAIDKYISTRVGSGLIENPTERKTFQKNPMR